MARTSTEVVPAGNITIEQVEDTLLHGNDLDVVSSDEAQDDMVRRILSAGSIEEAFQSFKATPATDLEGIKVRIKGIAWMRSAFSEGPKIYALLDATIVDSDMDVTISMGGRSLMASFVWTQRNAAMPFEGVFKREKSNSNTERSFWTFKLA